MPSIRLTVRVHPRAARERLSWDGAVLELWIHQPPVKGAANEAVIAEAARWLGVPPRSVRLISGHGSRLKQLEIEGVSALPPVDTRV